MGGCLTRTWYAATCREQASPEGEDGCADFVAVLHQEGGGTEGESLGVHLRNTRGPDQPGRAVLERFQPPEVRGQASGDLIDGRVDDGDDVVGPPRGQICLLYTSDAADERSSVDLGGRRILKKKKAHKIVAK